MKIHIFLTSGLQSASHSSHFTPLGKKFWMCLRISLGMTMENKYLPLPGANVLKLIAIHIADRAILLGGIQA